MYVYLSLVSFRIFLSICYKLCVYLSLVSLIFVPMFIWICEEMEMCMIQICHNILVVLSKASHEYKSVYRLIWIFAQNLCRASLKGWLNNHVRGCILEELLVPKFVGFVSLMSCMHSFITVLSFIINHKIHKTLNRFNKLTVSDCH